MSSNSITRQLVIPTLSVVRHQPVATKSAAVRRRFIRRMAAVSGIGVFVALVYVWIRVQVIQQGYETSRIRKETAELAEQKNLLEADVGILKSPARIETIARGQFGMRLPMSGEVIIVEGAE